MSSKGSTKSPRLTFSQREGVEPLPQQMMREEVSLALRARLFDFISDLLFKSSNAATRGSRQRTISEPWVHILSHAHVNYYHRMSDEFSSSYVECEANLKETMQRGSYSEIYGLLEFVLRHPLCPKDVAPFLGRILSETHAAFQIVDGDTFMPRATDEEASIVSSALEDLKAPSFAGARAHYKAACSSLSSGDVPGSMRESFNAMESITKLLTGEATFQGGVKKLSSQNRIHDTVRQGLEKFAAWTNAVPGLRHANEADEPRANVGEDDAIYFLAICGWTVSYLMRLGEKEGRQQ